MCGGAGIGKQKNRAHRAQPKKMSMGLTDQFRPSKTKVCRKCRIEKPMTEFYLNAESKDGRTNKCSSCLIEMANRKKAEEAEYAKKYFTF